MGDSTFARRVDIVRRAIDAVDHFFGPEDIRKVASEIDYLVLVAPYTPKTYHSSQTKGRFP